MAGTRWTTRFATAFARCRGDLWRRVDEHGGERGDSCAAGQCIALQGLAAGGGAALPDEQSRPRGGGAACGPGGVWRDWEGGAELGVLSRHCARVGKAGER